VVATLYLLGQSPLVWIAMGVLFGASTLAMQVFQQTIIGVFASVLTFVTLIAAGWMGWRRPWAYGLAAAVLGFALLVAFQFIGGAVSGTPVPFDAGTIIVSLIAYGAFQALVGAVSGFYGGYLRRRMAQPTAANQRRRR
jgi:MFS-type transporter involved in bile tolerance (Atg22 family)